MAQMAVPMNAGMSTRTRAMWVPREHGAWGMLLVPLATGAGVAAAKGSYVALAWFTIAAISLFCLRTPVESLLGTTVVRARNADERRAAWIAVGVTAAIALLALSAVFWGFQHRALFLIGAIAGLAFALQALLKRQRKFRSVAQLIGSAGLTSTAASAYYLVTGEFDGKAIVLWAVNWLFAAEQIEFVQTRIRGAKLTTARERLSRGRNYLLTAAAIVGTAILLALFRPAPLLMPFAFAPALARAGLWFTSKQKPLDVHKLGWMELGNAVLFAVVLVSVFRLS